MRSSAATGRMSTLSLWDGAVFVQSCVASFHGDRRCSGRQPRGRFTADRPRWMTLRFCELSLFRSARKDCFMSSAERKPSNRPPHFRCCAARFFPARLPFPYPRVLRGAAFDVAGSSVAAGRSRSSARNKLAFRRRHGGRPGAARGEMVRLRNDRRRTQAPPPCTELQCLSTAP